MIPERLTCGVPGCRRTYRNDEGHDRYLCGPHWRLAPRSMRQRVYRYRRRPKKDRRWQAVADRMWDRCWHEAIGRALAGEV